MEHNPNDAAPEPFPIGPTLVRNSILGALIAFALTFGICLLSGQEVLDAAGVAAMPALFAGPLVAGMLTVTNYNSYQERHGLH